MGFARDQASRHNLYDKRDNLGVGGTRDNFFVVMTCVGKVVVVMVSGDTGTNGSPPGKELFDERSLYQYLSIAETLHSDLRSRSHFIRF
jgi:hypothetical protein